MRIGDPAPALELPDTAGETITLPEPGEAAATVVAWTCNHCPYAIAWQGRIEDAARDYADRDVRFLAVNSNDGERYPADSLAAMVDRVEAEDWPFPYLHDADQSAAREWDAKVTPHLFVLDRDLRLAYEGAADADHRDRTLGASWLREALDAVIAGEQPARAETEPVGCSIKWK